MFLNSPDKYDYIIAGAGCAGLSLAVHLIQSGKFSDRKILIVDKDEKQKNDRTWCFWETSPGLFESVVYKQWGNAWFYGEDFSRLMDISPYQYKLIRGIDFYTYCLDLIRQQPNFEIRTGAIKEIQSSAGQSWVQIDEDKIFASYIFNSILFEKPLLKEKDYYLLQHFKGWVIETEQPVFNPGEATLMDFRVNQQHGTTFVYVMPFSTTRALVEYTLFTEQLLAPAQYEEGLKEYITKFIGIDNYQVTEEEFGVIPMTNYKFPAANGGIINIGTAGGQTKASSGYTFRYIQKHVARLVENLIKRNNPFIPLPGGPARFKFYDSTLLHILKNKQLPGDKIFTRLFKKNKPQQVLRFLDNESSLADELRIISSLPTLPFLKAAIKQV
ncbi:MAG: lycopene cyclase family protein [Bacteroidota bacterium]|nr:lycopene cyclase family protein [Bacteroidota bacterium]